MKTYFYQIFDPYYAVIKARDEDEVLETYERIVSSIEENDKDRFFSDMETIDEESVRWKLSGCINEDTGEDLTPEEQEEVFNRTAPDIILIEEPR